MKLLPCPFCGKEPELFDTLDSGFMVYCSNPECRIQYKRLFISQWNRRDKEMKNAEIKMRVYAKDGRELNIKDVIIYDNKVYKDWMALEDYIHIEGATVQFYTTKNGREIDLGFLNKE